MRIVLAICLAPLLAWAWFESSTARTGLPPHPAEMPASQPGELAAWELLDALDALTTRNTPTNWVDWVEFCDPWHGTGALMEDAFFLQWLHEEEITLAYAGMVDLALDHHALQEGIDDLLEARGARSGRQAVRVSVLRVAASPRVLAAEIAFLSERSSTGYFVVWSRAEEGWVYRRSRSTFVACG